MLPDIGHGKCDEFGERAGAIHAHALRMRAQVTPASHAIATTAAHDMAFAGYDLAGMEVDYIQADGGNFAHELVADRHGHGDGPLGPFIPLVDVQVGAANAGAQHTDQHFVDADFGLRNVLENEAGLALGL